MAAVTARQFSYAPEDPTLPKPWRGLVDGRTGYLYFWNTETNVTQYERPVAKCDAFQGHTVVSKAAGPSTEVERSVREDSGGGGPPEGSRNADSNYRVSGESADYSQIQPASLARHSSSDSQGNLSSESYRRLHEITVLGGDVPAPLMTWDDTGFPSEVLREIRSAGFSTPTPIQAQSWPIAMLGRDIVAVAKTGSGKTLGFLFPGFMHLGRLRNNPKIGPTVLVLSPTRELATQILDEAVKFGKSSRFSCTCLYGGAPKGPQLRDIERGVDVVVATPGRLNDILEMRRISLHQVSYLVLDEADRMLDMGFEPQIRKIVKEIPSRRQTLMFTATWPKGVRKIATDLLTNPVQVNIGNVDELVANKAITQYVEVISSMEKRRRLEQILRSQEPGSKIIIFCSTKRMCDMLVQGLANKVGAAAIHGDKSQAERDQVLSQFRSGRSPVLVATDVAARGLDVKDIRIVINYDFPTGVEDYVHRIGRTGRGGATGVSYTFFCDQDAKYAADLIKILEGANQQVPPELRDMSSRGGSGGYGKFSRWGSGSNTGGRSYGGKGDAAYGRSQDNAEHSYGRYEGGGSCHRQDNHAGYGGGYQNSCNQDSKGSWANDNRGGGSYDPYPDTISVRDQSPPTRSRSRSRSRSPTFRRSDTEPLTRGWSAHDSEISTTPSLSFNADNQSRCVVPPSEDGVGPSTTIQ